MQVLGIQDDASAVMRFAIDGEIFCVRPRDNAEYMFWLQFESGEWEPQTRAVLTRFLDKDHSYVDIGGWIGPTALYGARRAKACYVVEPDPIAADSLRRNLTLSQCNNAFIFEGAISTSCEVVSLGAATKRGDSMSSMLRAGAANSWEVPGLTLEVFFERAQIRDCSFIKMDIEGAETMVVPAIRDFLNRLRPTLYLSLHPPMYGDRVRDMSAILESLQCYRHLYSANGKLLDPSQILAEQDFCEILATDLAW